VADEEMIRRRRWMGRAFVATVIPVGMVSAAAHPAFADPVAPATADAPEAADAAPNSGAVPLPSQALQFPTQATAAGLPTDAVGALAADLVTISDTTQRLGEQAKAVQEELDAAVAKTRTAREAWQQADVVLTATRARVEATQAAATQAGTDAAGVASLLAGTAVSAVQTPTTAPAAPDPTSATPTGATTPSKADGTANPDADATTTAAAREEALSNRAEAVRTERAARQALDAATDVEHEVAGRYAVVLEQFHRHQAALETLNTRNANQLEAARAARDAYESSLAAARGASTNIAGMQASPDALAAVAFALSQLGKPYEWAAEGPNSYDCSGLVFASYLSVGVKLPRVANNQYGAGQPVLASQLLPGDLIFFSTNPSDWRQIHHVAMYIGNGKVVQAPTFGEVVKISPIWFSEYFGATRIIPAIAAPGTAEPTPSATPSDSATPSPTGTPTPSPTGTPTPAPTGTPTPTTTGTPTPTTTTPPATPTGTPSPGPNPSPTPTPSATGSSPTASATTTPASPASPTTTPAAAPDPAVSTTSSSPTAQGRRRRRS